MKKNLDESLFTLLKTLPRFVDESGELVKTVVINSAWNSDPELIRLLLGDAGARAKFFAEIEGHRVFNLKVFVDYVEDKNFLANSYTRFRNRIGLNIGDKFLHERGEVSLVWPYKDCVLEGGQTREEEKRKEIFFNEILAHDEIDRLFDPKALTNWKRYTEHGELDVEEFKWGKDGTLRENLIIKGNNLLALHSLKARYAGKVKLIFIDPPYNTGNDGFSYNDKFNHSSWLSFMRCRLEVARDMLTKDGALFVILDDTEAHYCKVMADEVFGRENFVAHIAWQKRTSPDDRVVLGNGFDNILAYGRTLGFTKRANGTVKTLFEEQANRLPLTDKQKAEYKNPDDDERGPWVHRDFTAQNKKKDGKISRQNQLYWIVTPSGKKYFPDDGYCWKKTEPEYEELKADGRIWFGADGSSKPRRKMFLSEKKGIQSWTWWPHSVAGTNEEATKELIALFGSGMASDFTPKPERLVERIIRLATSKGDLVLDFFAGSGTAAAVAHKMGRRWLAVEQMNYIHELTVERLKKVIEGEQGGISKSVNWQGGGDFIYCELMQYNGAWLDKIQAAQSSAELVRTWRDMARNSFLNWYVNPECPEDAVDDFIAIGKEKDGLAQQKRLLAELLDKNQLYVNLTEIDDEDFDVSEEDKALNHEFFTGEPVDPDEGLELREEFVEMVEASIAEVEAGAKTTPIREAAENLGIKL